MTSLFMSHKWKVTSSSLPWISIISKNIELVLFDFVFYKESTLLLIKCNYSRSCSQDFHFSGFIFTRNFQVLDFRVII